MTRKILMRSRRHKPVTTKRLAPKRKRLPRHLVGVSPRYLNPRAVMLPHGLSVARRRQASNPSLPISRFQPLDEGEQLLQSPRTQPNPQLKPLHVGVHLKLQVLQTQNLNRQQQAHVRAAHVRQQPLLSLWRPWTKLQKHLGKPKLAQRRQQRSKKRRQPQIFQSQLLGRDPEKERAMTNKPRITLRRRRTLGLRQPAILYQSRRQGALQLKSSRKQFRSLSLQKPVHV
jgi:hypothetical protein